MADRTGERPAAARPGWQDWQRWVEGVDWPDWRSWLKQIASTDWASGSWPGTGWEQSPQAGEVPLILRAWEEDEPGDQIGQHLASLLAGPVLAAIPGQVPGRQLPDPTPGPLTAAQDEPLAGPMRRSRSCPVGCQN